MKAKYLSNQKRNFILKNDGTDLLLTTHKDIDFIRFKGSKETQFLTDAQLNTETTEIVNELSASSLYFDNVSQFVLLSHENFEQTASGWSFTKTSDCIPGNKMLGGPCKLAEEKVSKTFSKLPVHTYLKISGNISFFDGWEGEHVYVSVDNDVLYSDSYKWCSSIDPTVCKKKNIDVCGLDVPDKLNSYFEFTSDSLSSSPLQRRVQT